MSGATTVIFEIWRDSYPPPLQPPSERKSYTSKLYSWKDNARCTWWLPKYTWWLPRWTWWLPKWTRILFISLDDVRYNLLGSSQISMCEHWMQVLVLCEAWLAQNIDVQALNASLGSLWGVVGAENRCASTECKSWFSVRRDWRRISMCLSYIVTTITVP